MPNHHHGILVKCLMGLPVAGSSLMLCAYFIEFMPTLDTWNRVTHHEYDVNFQDGDAITTTLPDALMCGES